MSFSNQASIGESNDDNAVEFLLLFHPKAPIQRTPQTNNFSVLEALLNGHFVNTKISLKNENNLNQDVNLITTLNNTINTIKKTYHKILLLTILLQNVK